MGQSMNMQNIQEGMVVVHPTRGIGTVIFAGETISRVLFNGKSMACWNSHLSAVDSIQ